jgi:benzoate-CoA ligase family protein
MLPYFKSLAYANSAQHLLDRHLEAGRGDQPAVHYQEQTFSYSDIFSLAGRAGNLFAEAGLGYENRVVIILPDSPLYLAAFFGAIRIGAVPVPVSTRLSLDDYQYIFADCRPMATVIASGHLPIIETMRKDFEEQALPFPRAVWVVGEGEVPSGFQPFAESLQSVSADCPARPTCRDDMALIQYTSGSTGIPKGVVHLHRGLIEVGRGLVEKLQISESDLCFSAAKLSFGYGLGNSVIFPFSQGASSILYPGLVDPFNVLDILTRLKPTVFFGIPSLYSAILDVPQGEKDFDLSSLRLCVSAGEHLNARLLLRWKDTFGHEIVDGIGSTECLHIFISGEPGSVKAGSTGTPVPGYEVKLLDEQGRAVGPGETGELYVKSDCNASRYWNKYHETKGTMIGQWTRTGDLFYQENEYFYFVGRSDDVIKVRGSKVTPFEIEECLLSHAAVKECGVIGITNEEGITSVSAYICLHEGWTASQQMKKELKQYVRNLLAPHKCPRRIEFISEVPKTTTGKIARYKLRAGAELNSR